MLEDMKIQRTVSISVKQLEMAKKLMDKGLFPTLSHLVREALDLLFEKYKEYLED